MLITHPTLKKNKSDVIFDFNEHSVNINVWQHCEKALFWNDIRL